MYDPAFPLYLSSLMLFSDKYKCCGYLVAYFFVFLQVLESLKILDLSCSYGLTSSPDFSQLPNLERLILKYCKSLVSVHESIGELGRLVLLNLKGCENLRNLPNKVFQLKSLEKLILSGCSRLEGLPPDLGKLVSLNGVHPKGTN